MKSDIGFRNPLWCQLTTSLIVAVSVWFLPKFPRWLMAQDDNDSATAVLAGYHGEGSVSYPMVQLQLKEMFQQIGSNDSDKRWWD